MTAHEAQNRVGGTTWRQIADLSERLMIIGLIGAIVIAIALVIEQA